MFYRTFFKKLERWTKKKGRKPLLLRDTRQVGKITAAKLFARNAG
jgi:predicted AAA+ superfamily ATPase